MKRSGLFGLLTCASLFMALLLGQAVFAQHEHTEPQCDLEAVIAHQADHAEEIANFAHEAKEDLDAAMANLYRAAIAYQALAAECGFNDTAAVEEAHNAEHEEADGHSEGEEVDPLEIAHSIGNPEQGKLLFNTVRTEVSFACATCHRVDSTDVLIGPGLLGVAGISHDHTDHSDEEATAENHDHDKKADAAPEATPTAERTVEETIAYLHASIVDPSAYIVPGSVDNLMPKTYGEFLTEQEVNDLVAYLFTLQ
jgi:cytochrome c2